MLMAVLMQKHVYCDLSAVSVDVIFLSSDFIFLSGDVIFLSFSVIPSLSQMIYVCVNVLFVQCFS